MVTRARGARTRAEKMEVCHSITACSFSIRVTSEVAPLPNPLLSNTRKEGLKLHTTMADKEENATAVHEDVVWHNTQVTREQRRELHIDYVVYVPKPSASVCWGRRV